jgi:hypothetical protein
MQLIWRRTGGNAMLAPDRSQIPSWFGMRSILSQLCLAAVVPALIAGCSNTERAREPAKLPPGPAAASPVPLPSPAPARPKRTVTREARETREPEKVAAIDPKSLIGLNPAAVEKLLGTPNAVAKSDPSLVWTYSAPGCSFQIVFYPDLKTEIYRALKYSAGAEADAACVRNILTVRSNGPS